MKTLTLYHPNIWENALSEFDRCISSLMDGNYLTPADKLADKFFSTSPRIDIRDTEKTFLLEAELPGCNENEIQIHVENNTLTIESVKDEAKEEKKEENFLLRERRSSSFKRAFKLPANADTENIAAAFKNGILSMEIAKKSESSNKKLIQINKEAC